MIDGCMSAVQTRLRGNIFCEIDDINFNSSGENCSVSTASRMPWGWTNKIQWFLPCHHGALFSVQLPVMSIFTLEWGNGEKFVTALILKPILGESVSSGWVCFIAMLLAELHSYVSQPNQGKCLCVMLLMLQVFITSCNRTKLRFRWAFLNSKTGPQALPTLLLVCFFLRSLLSDFQSTKDLSLFPGPTAMRCCSWYFWYTCWADCTQKAVCDRHMSD